MRGNSLGRFCIESVLQKRMEQKPQFLMTALLATFQAIIGFAPVAGC